MINLFRKIFALVLIVSNLFYFGCNQRTVDPDDSNDPDPIVSKYGTASTFDIATWNIEQFPQQGSTTIKYVAQMVKDLDIDMFGLQEMNDISAFNQLLDSLPDYEGKISSLPSSYLKP